MKSDKLNKENIDKNRLPYHVAIIMDGNGRWAKQKLMNRVRGHEKGSETVRSTVSICRELGIKVLTLYAFSTENWARPKSEVKALMSLLKKFIKSEREQLHKQGIRLGVIGQKHRLPNDVQKELDITMEHTCKNKKMLLNLALSYGGREEITNAVKEIAAKVEDKLISCDEITEEIIAMHLYTKNIPDPDLLIRTSGEMRLSNFLLWQAGYAEIFFTDTLWPDFTKQEIIDIIKNYQKRDRRFGKIVCTSNDGSPQ